MRYWCIKRPDGSCEYITTNANKRPSEEGYDESRLEVVEIDRSPYITESLDSRDRKLKSNKDLQIKLSRKAKFNSMDNEQLVSYIEGLLAEKGL